MRAASNRWPGGDGAEKAQKGRQADEAALCGQIAPADVDQVAQGGKGVKADAQRKGQAVQRAGREGKKRQNQVIIFKKGQHQKQKGGPERQKPAPAGRRRGLDGQPEAPHKHAACTEQGKGQRLPQPAVLGGGRAVEPIEQQAGRQQQAGLKAFGSKL